MVHDYVQAGIFVAQLDWYECCDVYPLARSCLACS